MFKHWTKKRDANAATFPATPADSNAASEMEQEERIFKTEPDYHYAKFNVTLPGPDYTEEEYEKHLKSEDWDKQETDYLVNLVIDYDIRWVVIADRYAYQPPDQRSEGENSMAVSVQAKKRTMEDMKARYYEIAAKAMALHHPMSSMSNVEFEVHEKMTKFDPVIEMTRKRLAEVLLARSPDEIKEEEILLGELKRIVSNEERFFQERKELYTRLEVPYNSSSSSTYYSSAEIHQVLSNLLNQDKIKKRRSLMEAAPNSASHTLPDRNQRQSTSGTTDKRGSLSGPSSYRQLSPREEQKFGVTHHERLTAGVVFRHEKITKLSQAKSNAQATKIGAALTELKIPLRLVMPTAKVVSEYERLIQSIHNLLEVRKVGDKLDTEIKVLKAQKENENARERGEASVPPASSPGIDEEASKRGGHGGDSDAEEVGAEDDEAEEEREAEDEDEASDGGEDEVREDDDEEDENGDDHDEEDDDKQPSPRASVAPSVGTRKRSASIMSVVSNKSSKRPRK